MTRTGKTIYVSGIEWEERQTEWNRHISFFKAKQIKASVLIKCESFFDRDLLLELIALFRPFSIRVFCWLGNQTDRQDTFESKL